MRAIKIKVIDEEVMDVEDSLGFLNELSIGVTSNILGNFGKGRQYFEPKDEIGVITNESEDKEYESVLSIAV